MPKLIITMKRRQGMPLDEFISYYNEHHLVNVSKILPPSDNSRRIHIRNFVNTNHPLLGLIGDGRAVTRDPAFDCLTEIIFESDESAAAFFGSFFEVKALELIKEDEARFIDPDSVRFYMVDTIEVVRGG